jgi:hypothetical protein
MSAVRLCDDCRWAALEGTGSGMVWRCTHSRAKFTPPPDYVTGKPVKPYQLKCYNARYFNYGIPAGRKGDIGKRDERARLSPELNS